MSPPAGREEEKKLSQTHPFSGVLAVAREPTRCQWRVEGTRRHYSCAQKTSLTLFRLVEGYPCNCFGANFCNCKNCLMYFFV
jgi:hypothetical protein